MAKSLDDLIEFLLEEIALCGKKGVAASDILALMEEFYDIKPTKSTTSAPVNGTEISSNVNLAGVESGQNDASTTVSTDPPVKLSPVKGRQNLDEAFQARIWKWLTDHPGVCVYRVRSKEKKRKVRDSRKQDKNNDGGLGPRSQTKRKQPKLPDGSVRESPAISAENGASPPLASSARTKHKSEKGPKNQQLRLRVTEDRSWIALTGHLKDYTKCPRMEFACLSAIANRRYAGILQPELIQVTGQDKRSLPRRTHALANKGYIEKNMVFTKGLRTSYLILPRYAKRNRLQEASMTVENGSNEGHLSSTGSRTWEGSYLEPHAAVIALVREVKKHNVIALADLKWKLGISGPSWQYNVFKKVLRKLDLLGCIQRVSAQAEVSGVFRNFPSAKFIREPQDHEWELSWAVGWTPQSGGNSVTAPEPNDNQEIEAEDSHFIEQTTGENPEIHAQTKALEEVNRPLMHWKPRKAVGNMIFNIVEASGTDGISTMRPMDAVLDHICRNGSQSQPAHLRHLALIRDTAQSGKIRHYQYYSPDNFQKLVDQGKTSWESVTVPPKERKKKTGKGANVTTKEIMKYDEYGFPIFSDNFFMDKDGVSTLSESVAASNMSEIVYSSYDPVLCEREDGTLGVDWGASLRRGRPSKRNPKGPVKILSKIVGCKPRGRPRKYPKGQEPYRKGKGNKEETVENEKAQDSADERAAQQLQTEAGLKRTAEEANLEGVHPQNMAPSASEVAPAVKPPGRPRGRPRKRQRRVGNAPTCAPSKNSKRTADEAGLAEEQLEIVPSTDTVPASNDAAGSRPSKRQKKTKSSAMTATPRTSKRQQVKTSKVRENLENEHTPGTVVNPPETSDAVPQVSPIQPSSTGQTASETPGQHSNKRKRTKISKVAPIPSEEANNNATTEPNPRKSLVTVLPPGSRPGVKKRGRPKKSKIVVFKFGGLRSLSWFNDPATEPAGGITSNEIDGHVPVQTAEKSTSPIPSASEGSHQDTRTSSHDDETLQRTSDPPELDDDAERPSKRPRLQEADSSAEVRHQSVKTSAEKSRTLPKRKRLPEPKNSSEPSAKRRRKQKAGSKEASEPRNTPCPEPDLSAVDQSPGPPSATEDQQTGSNAVTLETNDTRTAQDPAAANDSSEQRATDIDVVPSAETTAGSTSERRPGTSKPVVADCPPAGGHTTSVTDMTTAEPAQAQTRQAHTSKGPVKAQRNIMNPGSVNFKRKRIIMELVDKLGGVYPGDRELWYPFSAMWMKEIPGSGMPDYKTVLAAQKATVDSGQLKMFKFCYTNSKGLQSEKKILARMEINANSPLVKDLEQKMKDADTTYYIPPEAGISVETKRLLALRKSNGSRHAPLPKSKLVRDPTVQLKLLRPPPVTPEQQKRAEERGLQKKQKDERRMQGLMDRQMLMMSINEKREAARTIRKMAKSTPQSRTDGPRIPRIGRLHGLYQGDDVQSGDDLQQSATGRTLYLEKADISLVEPQFLTSLGIQDNADALKRRAVFSINYKLQRTGLNAPKQTFHSASGTFGTFFSVALRTKREKRKQPKKTSRKPSQDAEAGLPNSLEDIIAQTKARGLIAENYLTYSNPGWSRFEDEIQAVSMWEKHIALTENQSSSWTFINHTFSEPHVHPPTVRKLKAGRKAQTARTTKARATEAKVTKAKTSRPRTKNPRKSKKFMTRTLSAPPERVAEDGTLLLNPGRRRRAKGTARITAKSLTERELQKLLTAVTVIRTLTGGIDRNIDWVIVARFFPAYDHAVLKRSWGVISGSYKVQLEKLQSDFQKAFLTAYAAGNVPSIDYESLRNYDWERVVNWALKNLEIPDSKSLPELPTSREEFEQLFEIQHDPDPHHPWRDDYFGLSVPVFKRHEAFVENTLTIRLADATQQGREEKDEEVQVAKSWIRANVLTSQEVYKPELAKEQLTKLGEECLAKALNESISTKVVRHANKGRSMPGRNYNITDQYLNNFKKHLDEPRFNIALAYKAKMDETFKTPGTNVPFTYYASDGEAIALLNLIAHQRVRLVTQKVPMNRFGMLDGSYRTRFMDKTRLHFDLFVVPTGDYVFGNPLLSTPLPPAPRPDGHDGRSPIPVWYDIHGNLLPTMWKKALLAIMIVISMRTGIKLKELRRCLKSTLEEWELKLVLKWLVDITALREVDGDGELEGWAVGEWWWMVIETADVLAGVATETGVVAEAGPGAGSEMGSGNNRKGEYR
ncbi:MAG: RNA polymerase III transcription initiation factor complex subunit [Peltula sp. TS41687]|nr:MAG: RNA polymerase III transcription initiation factor complex subunit [Peltula sp. TS41687]